MPTYFKHGDGKTTIETVARWLIQEASASKPVQR